MVQALCGCYAKIERADKQIMELKDATQEYFNLNGTPYSQEYDENLQLLSYIFADQVPLPLEFSVIIGEILHQQRSALDHLVWQLVLHQNCTPPSKSGFPIFTSEAAYDARSGGMIEGVSESAGLRIRNLQPFHGGVATGSDPLWLLQKLNNIDKHRLLIVTRLFIDVTDDTLEFSPGISTEDGAEFTIMVKTPVESGRVFLQIRTQTKEANLQADLSAEVMLKEDGMDQNEPVIPLLTQLSGNVRNIINSFEPEFV